VIGPAGPVVGFVAPDDPEGVRRLEEAGAASLWVGGHIASTNPSPEPLAWLARLAAQTRTATIGTATLVLPLYPPALVAKQAADIDRAAGGRVALGVGVGGEYPSDFAAVQVPVGERGSRTDEAIGLLRRFWTASPVHHEGRHFRFDGVRIHPAPARAGGPPVIVTGRRDVAMRRAARLGDGWMPYLYSPRRYAESVERIGSLAAGAGRDLAGRFEWLAYVFVALDDSADAARRAALRFFGSTYGQDLESMLDRVAVAGDGDGVGERLQAYVDAGARHLVVCPIPGAADAGTGTAERLLAEIVPRLTLPA
jgi:alkanesulfonate monooxygenase SsuD/methylene tetrahydromethanopterin reductase-like flavin-dependent oxidoreductase (luciferase family)